LIRPASFFDHLDSFDAVESPIRGEFKFALEDSINCNDVKYIIIDYQYLGRANTVTIYDIWRNLLESWMIRS